MANQDLKNYIQQSRQAGKTDDQIKQELLGAGYPVGEIEEALSQNPSNQIFNNSLSSESQPPRWLRISFKIIGVLGFLFLAYTIGLIVLFYSQFKSLGLLSSLGSFLYIMFGFVVLMIIALGIYSYGLFKLKKWAIPLLILSAFLSLIQLVPILLNFSLGLSFILSLISPIISILIAYAAWVHRNSFSGSYKNPLVFTVVLIGALSLLLWLLLPYLPDSWPYVDQLKKLSSNTSVSDKTLDKNNSISLPSVSPQATNQPENFQPSNPDSWQTFRNDEYGFELKYPSIWEVSQWSGRGGKQGNSFIDSKSRIEQAFIAPQGYLDLNYKIPSNEEPTKSIIRLGGARASLWKYSTVETIKILDPKNNWSSDNVIWIKLENPSLINQFLDSFKFISP